MASSFLGADFPAVLDDVVLRMTGVFRCHHHGRPQVGYHRGRSRGTDARTAVGEYQTVRLVCVGMAAGPRPLWR
jgi:hypothetical protein